MLGSLFSTPTGHQLVWYSILVVWTLVWKGLALWRAGRQGQKWWFIAFLVVNTIGILEILYLYVFSQKVKKSDDK